MLLKCKFCGKDSDVVVTSLDNETMGYCREDYYSKLCLFCKPPRPHESCPGHSDFTSRDGNRFLEDPAFMEGFVGDA